MRSKKRDLTIDLGLVRSEVLTPREFLQLVKEQPMAVGRSRFLPPSLGQSGFGGFEVQYSVPQLKRVPA